MSKEWVNGKLVDLDVSAQPIKTEYVAAKHPKDDDRELVDVETGKVFDSRQRFSHFEGLVNMHVINRQYPPMEEQLDMLYWDKVNGTENWKAAIDKVKADNPKSDTSDMSKLKDEFGL